MLLYENESQDYIHRVGRTARAGRSGVAISLVNQYELEWYIQIEKLIGKQKFPFTGRYKIMLALGGLIHYFIAGKKLPEFPAEEEEVLLLLERVTEAKRISLMVMPSHSFLLLSFEY